MVASIPTALMAAAVCLWAGGQTLNLMTLGGLALAVGVLVDEADGGHRAHARADCAGHSRGRAIVEASRADGGADACWPCLIVAGLRSSLRSSWSASRNSSSSRCRSPWASPCWRPTCCPARSCRCWPPGAAHRRARRVRVGCSRGSSTGIGLSCDRLMPARGWCSPPTC